MINSPSPMSNEEYNSLLNGPLAHPMMPMRVTRLMLALRAVLEVTGDIGAEALRQHCREREAADRRQEEEASVDIKQGGDFFRQG